MHFGVIYKATAAACEVLDEVVVSVFRAPHSYTGENSVEISCHASSYIVSEISALLIAAGARPAQAGEFTRRAFLNGKMDLAQAEAVADLIASSSEAAHRVAFNQMKGGVSAELQAMRAQLLDLTSLLELELDFSEEDVEFADRGQLRALVDRVLEHIGSLAASFRLGNAIKNGVPTAIVGATNVGKSTLLNALLGEQRAIVSNVHGTTRDTIEETLNIDGVVFRFIDTAGLRETSEEVEKIGIERTRAKLAEASIVLGILDPTRSEAEVTAQVAEIVGAVDMKGQELILVVNKADVFEGTKDGSSSDFEASEADFRAFSACNNFVSALNKSVSRIENQLVSSSERGEAQNSASETQVSALGASTSDFKAENSSFEAENLSLDAQDSVPETQNFDFDILSSKVISSDSKIPIFCISAKNNVGISELKKALAASQKDKISSNSSSVLISNLRHYNELKAAENSLLRVRENLEILSGDLLAQDLRLALSHLGSIVGEIDEEEILGNIFKKFCIGK